MLPKIDNPIYTLTLPISKQELEFRPFTVKEQKILMMAQQADDSDFVNNNVKQIIKNCCISEIDVNKLSQIDVEYFFIQLRARSVGEIVETQYRCNNKISPEQTCNNLMDVNINLLDITVEFNDNSDTVQLTDEVGLKMKYPDANELNKIDQNKDLVSLTLEVIYNCIDYIFDDNNFYYKHETPKQEVMDFLETMTIDQFKKVENYFNNLPVLKETLEVQCNKCGFKHSITIKGLENFLG